MLIISLIVKYEFVTDLAFKILTWLGYSNSAFNPIIYSIFNTEFREAFKKILTSRYPLCCGYQSVRANTPTRNDNFVTDYGTKTLVVRRSGSLGLSGVDPTPRSSAESVRPLREYHIWQEDGNSNNGLLDKSDVVWKPEDWYGNTNSIDTIHAKGSLSMSDVNIKGQFTLRCRWN